MLLKELIEQHNINPNELPQGILNINLENKYLKDYTEIHKEENTLTFRGTTGKKVTNEIIISLNIPSLQEQLTIKQAKEILTTPCVVNNIFDDNWRYSISYNVLGGEINRV